MIASALLGLLGTLFLYWLYQIVIGARGLLPERPAPRAAPRSRFAIVVPAHNEEAVLDQLLQSLEAQSYPRERFDMYVAADACTDRTEEIANRRGAKVIASRGTPVGKAMMLGRAFAEIDLARYDAVAVFDSDNVVASDWLGRMNDFLAAHPDARVVQGYLDSKNPDDSWVTRVYALQYWFLNRFWSLARARWRLSVNVGGTGFVIRTSELRELGWRMQSLTEDLELTCQVVLAGGRVWWNDAAVAYDEKPISGSASRVQRSRWLQGHYWLASRYVGPLLRSAIRHRRFREADLVLHLLAPGRSAMSYAPLVLVVAVLLIRRAAGPDARIETLWTAVWPFGVFHLLLLFIVAPSLHDRRLTLGGLAALPGYILYGVLWLPAAARAALGARRPGRWIRTVHSRSIGIDDLTA